MVTTRISQFISRYYRPLRLAFLWTSDAFIVFLSLVVAIFLYTRVVPLPYTWPIIFSMAGILFGIQFAVFVSFQVYRVSFQYANLLVIVKVVAIQAISLLLSFYVLNASFPGLWPPLVAVLEGLLSTAWAVLLRVSGLIYLEVVERRGKSSKQVLIYGAGETGKNIVLALKNQVSQGPNRVRIAGFLDDDPKLKDRIIYGHKVLGDLSQLERILVQREVNEVIVAIPSLSGDRFRALRSQCRRLNIAVKAIPSFYEIYNRPPEHILHSLREIEFEDLVRRPKRDLPIEALQKHFSNKTILVTGGGGSIGFELVDQLLRLSCAKVIVADNCEFNLYQVEDRLRSYRDKLELRLIDAKVRDRVSSLFAECRPQILFHAAAYKHVHLVESNPVEGVINNLASMKTGADLAHEFGCEQFVFISSDKAVRPSSVMGATKRIGELYVQSLNARSSCKCFAVRFGNVLGSSGSLIPTVVKRVQRGEPVQLTHQDMTRYFMLLPEAILLVLEACLHAKGGEIFILDMGKPVKILDLVKDLILLLERKPADVPIEFIGPRPGEKIHEELFVEGVEEQQRLDGFFVSTSQAPDFDELSKLIDEILEAGRENQVERMLARLQDGLSAQAKTSV